MHSTDRRPFRLQLGQDGQGRRARRGRDRAPKPHAAMFKSRRFARESCTKRMCPTSYRTTSTARTSPCTWRSSSFAATIRAISKRVSTRRPRGCSCGWPARNLNTFATSWPSRDGTRRTKRSRCSTTRHSRAAGQREQQASSEIDTRIPQKMSLSSLVFAGGRLNEGEAGGRRVWSTGGEASRRPDRTTGFGACSKGATLAEGVSYAPDASLREGMRPVSAVTGEAPGIIVGGLEEAVGLGLARVRLCRPAA